MSSGMSREDAERFRSRWAPLQEIERGELRAMTIDDKFRCVSQALADLPCESLDYPAIPWPHAI